MAAADISFEPPRGMRDFYPEDMAFRRRLFDAWQVSARRFGFQQYDACVVESLELLERKAGEEISNQIYTFEDKSGRRLALRPEMTPSLARLIAARQGALRFPLKWFAIAQCFRYERMTRGRKREHYQWNLDIIGEPSVTAEAEVIGTAVDALRALGLGHDDVVILFSNRALVAELLSKLKIAPQHHAATFLALDKRGKISDEAIAQSLAQEGLDDDAIRGVFDLMRVDSLDTAAAILGNDSPACAQTRRFVDIVRTYGIDDVVRFDISVVRGLAYYTGIVFEAFDTSRESRAIFGGGRYDGLLEQIGGQPATGVGLGFGDVVIRDMLEAKGVAVPSQAADVLVGYMTDAEHIPAVRLAASLRQNGQTVDLELSAEGKPRKFFARADKGGYREAAFIGPDDAATGTVRVKDLAQRTERTVSPR